MLSKHRAQLRLTVRITIASVLAFALCRVFGLTQRYLAVLTAAVVTQSSVGASLEAMFDRFIGSLGGAAWGIAVLLAFHDSGALTQGIALTAAVAPLALLAAHKPAYRAAPITAIILLLAPRNAAGPLAWAVQRLFEIGLGSIVALGVSLLVLPTRAFVTLGEAAGTAIESMGDLAAILIRGLSVPSAPDAIRSLHETVRKALSQADAAATDAMRERATHLSGGPEPQSICRTLHRLRSDLAMIGRTAAEPLPEPFRTSLAESNSSTADAIAGFLHASGKAAANQQLSPSLEEVEAALARHASTMAELRKAGLTQDLPDETVERMYGLSFGLEQLHRDLKDLLDRIDALAHHVIS